MKFLIDRIAFRDALQRLETAIDRKPSRPALGGILIEANNDHLVLLASNLDLSVRYRLNQVQVDETGWALVPGPELINVFKDIEADTVSVNLTKKGQFRIEGGEDKCSLVSMDSSGVIPSPKEKEKVQRPDGFPPVPEIHDAAAVTVDKDMFVQMVQSTKFATSTSRDTRFATEGVLFETQDKKMTMVGTDGRRLACIHRQATLGSGEHRAVLLAPLLDQIVRFGQDEESESIEIFFLGNQVAFRTGNLECFGRIVEGEFPNWKQVVPADGKHVVRAHKESMTRKLRLARHLTQNAAEVVNLEFSADQLSISSEHEGRGRANSKIEVEYSGGGLTASFNPAYLLDGLKVAHCDQIELQMEEATRPAKLILGEDFDYVVMPLSTFG